MELSRDRMCYLESSLTHVAVLANSSNVGGNIKTCSNGRSLVCAFDLTYYVKELRLNSIQSRVYAEQIKTPTNTVCR